MMSDMVAWLKDEMQRRRWKPADLARESGITNAQVSRILNREQDAGRQACRAIAAAFEVPAYEVFVHAGLLPPQLARTAMIERIVKMLQELPEEDQEELFELAKWKAQRARRAKRQKASSTCRCITAHSWKAKSFANRARHA